MSPRKRMGNDPFESSPSFKEESQHDSGKSLLDTKTSNNSSINKTTAPELSDKYEDIHSKLNLALQNIAIQKEEIELLRKELNSLKSIKNYQENNPFVYWLRFWFPWFPR
ncbi:MAG: hypothetical protein PHX14_08850 [Syntrophomonadaceae bacterium]|nr:hypothetical protein [Syntrophomonadaceae bacterium]